MSTDQPDDQPGRPGQPDQPGGQDRPGGQPPPSYGGGPYGSPPPPSSWRDPYGSAAKGEGRYESGPYASNPYGDMTGAADPLADMPPLASRGKRLLARIIDALLIGIPVGVIIGLAQGGWDSGDDGNGYYQQVVFSVAYVIYEGIMLTNWGQTVGKRLMKVRVAMLADGAVPRGRPGWLRVFVYQLPLLVPCVGFLFWLVNVLFCTWDKPFQQCLHDKAAKTVVVAAD
jgi:uncharacterized RDD family membrane protein YckC